MPGSFPANSRRARTMEVAATFATASVLSALALLASAPARADITLETGNDSGSPGNDALHQNVCATSSTAPPGVSLETEGGFSLGFSSTTSSSSSTSSTSELGSGLHKVCFSFAATGPQLPQFSWTWLQWKSWVVGAIIKGAVYETSPVAGAKVVKRHSTTPQQDQNWVNYMRASRVSLVDGYSVARHNCRKFAQLEFDDAPSHW